MYSTLAEKIADFSPSIAHSIHQWTQETPSQEASISLVACGMLKAGKSTLMNMLTGHYSEENERFKTASVRETIRCSSYEYQGIRFTDTPGIDANSDDDEAAWNGILQADVILFIHNWKSELQIQETDFLRKMAQAIPPETLRERLILVQTGKEQIEAYQSNMQNQIEEQCRQTLGFAPPYFAVSNTRYRKGVMENKAVLAERSGISELRKKITEIQSQGMAKIWASRQMRHKMAREQLLSDLDQEIQNRKNRLNELRYPYKQSLTQFLEEMRRIQKSYQTQLQQYDQI